MSFEYESYKDKLEELRIRSLENLEKEWNPKNELFYKVDKNGEYRNFRGDTIVFFLNEEDKRKVLEIQNKLYSKIGKLLSKPLSAEYFHMTLHDLCNYNITANIENCVKKNNKKVKKILNGVKSNKVIKMNSLGLYNGGSAIGIMFIPQNKNDLIYLLEIRKKFDILIEQKDFYIPHITLGYYLPIDYNSQEREQIYKTINEINRDLKIEINIEFNKLEYVHFENMDKYITK